MKLQWRVNFPFQKWVLRTLEPHFHYYRHKYNYFGFDSSLSDSVTNDASIASILVASLSAIKSFCEHLIAFSANSWLTRHEMTGLALLRMCWVLTYLKSAKYAENSAQPLIRHDFVDRFAPLIRATKILMASMNRNVPQFPTNYCLLTTFCAKDELKGIRRPTTRLTHHRRSGHI